MPSIDPDESLPSPRANTDQDVLLYLLRADIGRYERNFRRQSGQVDAVQAISCVLSILTFAILAILHLYDYFLIPLLLTFLGYFKVSALVSEAFALAAHKYFLEEQLRAAWRAKEPPPNVDAPVPWDLAGGFVSRRFFSATAAHGLYIVTALTVLTMSILVPWINHAIPGWLTGFEGAFTLGLIGCATVAFRDHLRSYHQTLSLLKQEQGVSD